jgi:hypothetical protein
MLDQLDRAFHAAAGVFPEQVPNASEREHAKTLLRKKAKEQGRCMESNYRHSSNSCGY